MTEKKTSTIKREGLTDEQKYRVLKDYSQGISVRDIAKSVSRDRRFISNMIQKTLKEMNTIRETNDLVVGTTAGSLKMQLGTSPTKFLTREFLDNVEQGAEVYAYYFGQTSDNKFSLEQAGLDKGIAETLPASTRNYVYKVRGQFIRDIPQVRDAIRAEQDRRIKEYRIEKPQVQMEIVQQIEELKEICIDDPRQRSNLLKSIEMLGRSIGAFTDRIETTETDAKSGLEILMEKAKAEAGEVTVYEQEEN